jgi:hypothetical protein
VPPNYSPDVSFAKEQPLSIAAAHRETQGVDVIAEEISNRYRLIEEALKKQTCEIRDIAYKIDQIDAKQVAIGIIS